MSSWNAPLTPEMDEASLLSRRALSMNSAASASLVNRTHRVVRHRATAMKARRSYVRSLMAPLVLCSVVLTLAAFAVWNGMYQNDAAMQDVATLATSDTNNHLLVALLWFVPLTLVLLVAVWVRHVRSRESESAR